MLPTHVFADVVGCLNIYELDALLLAGARCSDLAHLAASGIRVFNFTEFQFNFDYTWIGVYNLEAGRFASNGTELKIAYGMEQADFITAALRNCVLGNLALSCTVFADAMREVAHTIVVKRTLFLFADVFANAHSLVEFVVGFRSVQVKYVVS